MVHLAGVTAYSNCLLAQGVGRTDVNVGKESKIAFESYFDWYRGKFDKFSPKYLVKEAVARKIEKISGADFGISVGSNISRLIHPGDKNESKSWAIGFALHFLEGGRCFAEAFERKITKGRRTFKEITGRYPRRKRDVTSIEDEQTRSFPVIIHRSDFSGAIERRLSKGFSAASEDVDFIIHDERDGKQPLRQHLEKVDTSTHVVFWLDEAAITSISVCALWARARQLGKPIIPVLVEDLDPSRLPGWVTDLSPLFATNPEDVDQIGARLKTSETLTPVHFDVSPPEKNYQDRLNKNQAIKDALLTGDQTVTLTTALQGAGGYGKTVLAMAICRDPHIQAHFHDGVFFLEVGRDKSREAVADRVSQIIRQVSSNQTTPFTDPNNSANQFARAIKSKRILLVADDIWTPAQKDTLDFQSDFIQEICPNARLLITTRVKSVSGRHSVPIEVDQMTDHEAVGVLAADFSTISSFVETRMKRLAKALHYCGQLLATTNSWLHKRTSRRGETLVQAIAWVSQRAESRIASLDTKIERDRRSALSWSISVSLAAIDPKAQHLSGSNTASNNLGYFEGSERICPRAQRFLELGIFLEDEDIPNDVIHALWEQTGGLSQFEAEDFLDDLEEVSLVRSIRLKEGTQKTSFHDNFLHFARNELEARSLDAKTHRAMAGALQEGRNFAKKNYAVKHLIRHLRAANMNDQVRYHLLDLPWMHRKIHAVGVDALYADYLGETVGAEVDMVGRALGQSLHMLRDNPDALEEVLIARLREML